MLLRRQELGRFTNININEEWLTAEKYLSMDAD